MEGRFARQESLNAINAQLLTIVTMVKSIKMMQVRKDIQSEKEVGLWKRSVNMS